ncbi:hypothetical protein ARALYDRAFT_894482 [Arabidopsis lyrata subsp. lyrata]|uniref:Uncharacterized protein n=1 Tax=Arabidopsis lyrata subsp. lyrata TaxID=81972 RepID=D7KV35_ARALL|nr:hypothetical protein ARALYDRAFT_894482 [Arabidopsis lyrata subsp. lyrata]
MFLILPRSIGPFDCALPPPLLLHMTYVQLRHDTSSRLFSRKLSIKGETGSDLLRLYFQSSPNFTEFLEAWKLHHGKQGLSYIFSLIQTILSHPEGKCRSSDIGRALDQFGRLLIEEKLDDIYKALSNSKEPKQQNAALSLLASIVRRGPGMASQMARTFDFQGFEKQAVYKKPRRAFVEFAISFLEVGKPSLVKSILKQKQLYSQLLQGLGEDDDDTLASVLSTFKDKILVEESSLSPGLMSALFGPNTLKQLVIISEREYGGIVNELAYDVLVKVCTDPSNGLMPDAERKGNIKRLLALMKSLKATEIGYPRDLLIAIIRGRPSLASAFLDEFPYNVEDFTSPYWFSSISLAADLVSSVRISSSFDFLNPDQPPSGGSEVHTIMKCICPRPFSRLLIVRGMQHSDFLVKHGTLRFLWETLRLWDSFVTAWKLYSSRSCSVDQIQASLERDIIGEVISFFPDFQLLWNILKVSQKLPLKRKEGLDIELVDREKRLKRSEKDVVEELADDMVIGGLGSDSNILLEEDTGDAQLTDQADAENEYLGIVSEIWGSEFCSKPIALVDETEMFFHIKLLDTLGIYVRSVPNVPEGLFDVFMKFLSSSSGLPAELQRALLSLLNECISWRPKSQFERGPRRIPPLMFKHLHVFITLLLLSSHDEVKVLSYNLARVSMTSTGAFDINPSEIEAWFRFLPSVGKIKLPLNVQSISSFVISFLCDAVTAVGNTLFQVLDDIHYWEVMFPQHSVSLKGNTYLFGRGEDIDEELRVITKDEEFLICFDFTRERFGPRFPLPLNFLFSDIAALSSIREEQLAVLFRPLYTSEVEIRVTTKVEPNEVLWSNFVTFDSTYSKFKILAGSFFINQ